MNENNLSLIPPISKKTVITCFLAIGWIFIALVTATAVGIVNYGEIKHFHWTISLSFPIWILLMANPNTQKLNDKDEKIAIAALTFTFAAFVIVVLAGTLN